MSASDDVPCAPLFATETMAELSARQGRVADAAAIYRHLIREAEGSAEGGERVGKWRGRLAELEAGAIGAGSVAAAGARSAVVARGNGATPRTTAAPRKETVPVPASPARASLVIREPVRSGQVVYAEGRDLIVMAAVHSGAQLMADGNIHVYAPLKGRAIAGAQGARDAQVFCLALEAELVGVDSGYVASDDIAPDVWGGPARVFLAADGACTVVPLTVGKPGASATSSARARWRL